MNIALICMLKNEQAVIARMLASASKVCDEAIIVDTGSSDPGDMYQAIRAAWPGNKRLVFSCAKWIDFAHNRSVLVSRGRFQTDPGTYLLVLDADETIESAGPLLPPGPPDADLYRIPVQMGSMRYMRDALLSTSIPWEYRCPVHEYLHTDAPFRRGPAIETAVILPSTDGARSRNPKKYDDDADMLAAHLLKHPDDARAQYYFAQSLRDAGHLEQARVQYLRRISLGGWDEEVFSAALEAAKCLERLRVPEYGFHEPGDPACDASKSEVIEAYLFARALRPSRAEPLAHAIRFCRQYGLGPVADVLEEPWRTIPMTTDILFVETDCYAQ